MKGTSTAFQARLGASEAQRVTAPARGVAWRDDGWLCFDDGPDLLAVARALRCVDPDHPEREDVVQSGASIRMASWHRSGAVAWVDDRGALWLLPRGGTAAQVRVPGGADATWPLEWSPSGRRFAFGVERGDAHGLAVARPGGRAAMVLPLQEHAPSFAAWSPDERRIAWTMPSRCWQDRVALERVCERDVHVAEVPGGRPTRLTHLARTDNPDLAWIRTGR